MDSKKNTTSPYPAEFRERAVQMVGDHPRHHPRPRRDPPDLRRAFRGAVGRHPGREDPDLTAERPRRWMTGTPSSPDARESGY